MNDTFKVFGIDPSTNNVGVAIYTLTSDLRIVDIITIQLVYGNDDSQLHNRLMKLGAEMSYLIDTYSPMIVAMESGFIGMLRPGAFGPLSQAIYAIQSAITNTDRRVRINTYPPSVVKVSIGAGAHAKKDDVRGKVFSNSELTPFISKYISEHEVDGLAIGYTLIQLIRANPLSLLFI